MSYNKRINVNELKIIRKLYLREIENHYNFMIKKYTHDEIINLCLGFRITFNEKNNLSISEFQTLINYIHKLILGRSN